MVVVVVVLVLVLGVLVVLVVLGVLVALVPISWRRRMRAALQNTPRRAPTESQAVGIFAAAFVQRCGGMWGGADCLSPKSFKSRGVATAPDKYSSIG